MFKNLDSFSLSLTDGNISKHCMSKLTTTSIQNQGVGFWEIGSNLDTEIPKAYLSVFGVDVNSWFLSAWASGRSGFAGTAGSVGIVNSGTASFASQSGFTILENNVDCQSVSICHDQTIIRSNSRIECKVSCQSSGDVIDKPHCIQDMKNLIPAESLSYLFDKAIKKGKKKVFLVADGRIKNKTARSMK
ncbi:hypothetical protein RhiirA1_448417 [Rhizophagus irregularis]|uniref:Uncharacterized protein n=1 Tax=Rhizophagus irregularis TaxID=588596 RepID=A0A2N0SJQ8_9GLOM|nr:hypothetical protein RhiirA1_448417 [Rhizophagus irregularis]